MKKEITAHVADKLPRGWVWQSDSFLKL